MKEVAIEYLSTADKDFAAKLDALLAWESVSNAEVATQVAAIVKDVKTNGDSAVLKYTRQFDHLAANSIADLTLDQKMLNAALANIDDEQRNALKTAAARIRRYGEHQKLKSWSFSEQDGTVLGQKVSPLDKVGLYVPGGKASYPSSVLMNAIPAKVAGVGELTMVVPTPNGEQNQLLLAAAAICEVDKVYTIGGAQAIAALAYGTASINAVDKITGPGNIYVATAKRMVFGTVGIDMIAGPSEILVVCDGKTDPDWIAMDMFSQAEHDEDAQAILISTDEDFLSQVANSINKLLPTLNRRDIAKQSLSSRGALIKVKSDDEAADLINYIAPEHLELSLANAPEMLDKVQNAGAIFMGRYTAEALGDYCAGPNHVLPTSRTARFASPLGVYDFQKRSSIINASAEGASELGKIASILARGEGLEAHARSAEYRIKSTLK